MILHIIIMDEIDFHIGTDCPFCFQQTTNSLISLKKFFYNHIYCSYCKLSSTEDSSFDSKFEMWFVDNKLICVNISDNIGNKYYYSEFSPIEKMVNLFQEDESNSCNVILKKWNLRDHMDILYNHMNEFDLSNLIDKPGIIFKIKQILDNPYISSSVKAQLFKIDL